MKSIDSEIQFNTEVLTSPIPALVDFWAEWCAPCKMVLPVLEELEIVYAGRVTFVKVNSEVLPQIAKQYHVRNLPTILILKGGVVEETVIGLHGRAALVAALDRAI